MLAKELGDDYFAEMEAHLGELAFRRGTLISAGLGKGSKGTGYLAAAAAGAELAGSPPGQEQDTATASTSPSGTRPGCGRCRS